MCAFDCFDFQCSDILVYLIKVSAVRFYRFGLVGFLNVSDVFVAQFLECDTINIDSVGKQFFELVCLLAGLLVCLSFRH